MEDPARFYLTPPDIHQGTHLTSDLSQVKASHGPIFVFSFRISQNESGQVKAVDPLQI